MGPPEMTEGRDQEAPRGKAEAKMVAVRRRLRVAAVVFMSVMRGICKPKTLYRRDKIQANEQQYLVPSPAEAGEHVGAHYPHGSAGGLGGLRGKAAHLFPDFDVEDSIGAELASAIGEQVHDIEGRSCGDGAHIDVCNWLSLDFLGQRHLGDEDVP